MKGQMFLLTAAILVTVLVSMKALVNLQQISSERDILDVSLEDLVFKNIKSEIETVIKISVHDENATTDNAINFINFTRNGTMRTGNQLNGIFVGTRANTTTERMNITVLNFLSEDNVNFTIRLNTSTVQINSTSLNDFNSWNNDFTFTAGDKYNLTINYTTPATSYGKNISVETRGGRDIYVGFFDFELVSQRATHRASFQQTFRIPR